MKLLHQSYSTNRVRPFCTMRETGRQSFHIRVHAAIKICWANNLKFSASCDFVHFNRFSTILNFTKL